MELITLKEKIKNYVGLTRKGPIKEIFSILVSRTNFGNQLPNYGDDAAVIPWNDGYLLFAADGIMTRLLINEPYAAGKSSVMVAVNDIYSMGGRPIAMVNVMASGEEAHRKAVAEGIKKGCEKLGVPMVGGHLHPDTPAEAPSLSVAILGWARKVIRSHFARPGDDIIFAVDLDGRIGCSSVMSWDANSGKTREELIYRLEVMPLIAEKGLAHAAKDVSNSGLIGTISIMMENSNKGAVIDIDLIPRPSELDPTQWFLCFQSFGFVLSVPPTNSSQVLNLFRDRKIDASVVGEVTKECKVFLKHGEKKALLFDFEKEIITGIKAKED